MEWSQNSLLFHGGIDTHSLITEGKKVKKSGPTHMCMGFAEHLSTFLFDFALQNHTLFITSLQSFYLVVFDSKKKRLVFAITGYLQLGMYIQQKFTP